MIDDSGKPTIKCSRNGPYLVTGMPRMEDAQGVEIPAERMMALCRCGGSSNKPFCDGTHTKNGFSGETLADQSKFRWDTYVGKEITVHDNRGICSHVGYCTVMRLNERPWVDPDKGSVEQIVASVEACPSGALRYTLNGKEYQDPDRAPRVTVFKNGPYQVQGSIELVDVPFAKGATKEHYALCRCGSSKNKPFCDGTHERIDFQDGAH